MSLSNAAKWITSLPIGYEPHVYRPKRILKKFLREKHILNETNYNLTGEEIEILSLDKSFVSDETLPGHKLSDNIREYVLKLNNTAYFNSLDRRKRSTTASTSIKGRVNYFLKRLGPKKSPSGQWRAPWLNWSRDPVCVTLLNHLDDALCKKKNRLRSSVTGRLPAPLRKAINRLRDNKKFFICQADKGGATVLWSRQGYQTESMRHLNDEVTYAEVFPVDECAGQVLIHLQRLKRDRIEWMQFMGLVTESEKEQLLSDDLSKSEKIPHIYFSAKIHKPIRPESGTWEGRPIVATYNGPLHWIDKYLAELTKPILPLIPLSLMDTSQFLRNIEPGFYSLSSEGNVLPAGTRVFTADARSLFTCIPWSDSTEAAVETYTEHYSMLTEQASAARLCKPPNPSVFRTLRITILENSFVQYQNHRVFHPQKGTAMGACISVFLAKCYMYRACAVPLLLNPPSHLLMLRMYIDDVFFATTSPAADGDGPLDEIVNSMSTPHVSFERTEASTSCDFLDVTVSVDSQYGFITKPFTKPNCSPCFLHYRTVGQSKNARAGVAYGEFIRIRRNSTYTSDFIDAALRLKRRLSTRGYPLRVIENSYEKALKKSRFELLIPKKNHELVPGSSNGDPNPSKNFDIPQGFIGNESFKGQHVRLVVPYGHGREFKRARFIMRRLDARIRKLHPQDPKWKSTIVFCKQKSIGSSWTAPFKFA